MWMTFWPSYLRRIFAMVNYIKLVFDYNKHGSYHMQAKELLDRLSVFFFICEKRLYFELISPVTYEIGNNNFHLFSYCKRIGAFNIITEDIIPTFLKIIYLISIIGKSDVPLILKIFVIIISLLGLNYTCKAVSWYLKHIFVSR